MGFIGQSGLKKQAILLALGVSSGDRHPYDVVLSYAAASGFTPPSAPRQIKQRALIDALMLAGIWAELDVFYVFLTDGDHNFARINWKRAGTFQATNTTTPATFLPNDGFKGGTGQLSTNFIPSISSKAQEGNLSVFGEVQGFGDSKPAWGVNYIPGHTNILFPSIGVFIYMQVGSATYSNASFTPGDVGFIHGQNNAGQQRVNLNGVVGASVAVTSGLDTTNPNFILGVDYQEGDGIVRCFGMGSKIVGKELALYTAWNTYKSTY